MAFLKNQYGFRPEIPPEIRGGRNSDAAEWWWDLKEPNEAKDQHVLTTQCPPQDSVFLAGFGFCCGKPDTGYLEINHIPDRLKPVLDSIHGPCRGNFWWARQLTALWQLRVISTTFRASSSNSSGGAAEGPAAF